LRLITGAAHTIADSRTALTEQARLLELLVSNQSIHALLDAIARFVERSEPRLLCSILLADDAGVALHSGAAPSLPPRYSAAIDPLPIKDGVGSCGTAAARREIVIVDDIANSPLWDSHRDLAQEHGLAACWSVPLLNDRLELLGTCAMYYREPCAPGAEQVDLIRVAGSLAALAIQRFRDQQSLHASEARYRELIDSCPDGMIAHVDGDLLYANAAARALLKMTPDEPVDGRHLAEFKLPGFRNDLLEHRRGLLSTHVRRTDGKAVFVEAVATDIRIDSHPATLLMFRDVTLRNTLENELLDAANREQQHLAFDLHDGLGQQLTGISLLLSSIRSRVRGAPADVMSDLELIGELVSKSINDTRLIAASMSPVTVERAGISGALKTLRDKAEGIYRLKAHLSIDTWPDADIDPYVANHIYRIVQEAVGNVARHARASSVFIEARAVGANLSITVSDDGCGIPETAQHAAGLGLRSMRYRAERISGSVHIERRVPQGTQLRLLCPLSRALKPR